jgi:ABC-type dipeptide/oligopeptide/nickel transport system permease subunit
VLNAAAIRATTPSTAPDQYAREAAKATGCQNWFIILRYILPNIAAPIMVVVIPGLDAVHDMSA